MREVPSGARRWQSSRHGPTALNGGEVRDLLAALRPRERNGSSAASSAPPSSILPAGGARAGGDEKSDDLHRYDLNDCHRRKDHRVSDVRSVGGGEPGRVDEDRWVARRPRGDAEKIVVRNLQCIVADEQNDQHHSQQDRSPDENHAEAGLGDGSHERLADVDAHAGEKDREAVVSQNHIRWQRHNPQHWTCSTQFSEDEGHDKRAAADAEAYDPRPGIGIGTSPSNTPRTNVRRYRAAGVREVRPFRGSSSRL